MQLIIPPGHQPATRNSFSTSDEGIGSSHVVGTRAVLVAEVNGFMKALILVDLQNDFLTGGALAVPDGDRVIPIANRLQSHFEIIVATQDWHPANHSSFAVHHPGAKVFDQIDLNGLRQTLWPIHCVQNTSGADFAPGLIRDRLSKVFPKGTEPGIDSYSGFFDNGHKRSTGLGEWLRTRGVTEVFICGLATDYCVKFTALHALQFGFQTCVVEDACRGVNLEADDVSKSINEMKAAGIRLVQSADLITELELREATTLYTGRFLALVKRGHWEYANRTNATGAAIIVAVTNEQKLLLVEQYRIPVHARTIELPAGIIGDEPESSREDHVDAARRELEEETGYRAEGMDALTHGPASGGLTSEVVTLFLATRLRRVGAGGGISQENITVHEVPVSDVDNWLEEKAKAGLLIDPKIYAGLYFLHRKTRSR